MELWYLEKDFRFEASHQLPNHDGKCKRLHGHSWKMTVKLSGKIREGVENDPQAGMVMDYGKVKRIVQPLVDVYLDHWHLNDTTGLTNPTSEELARWVYKKLKPDLTCLRAVLIEETCTARCIYVED